MQVSGFDLSAAMMSAAVGRIGPCVAVADIDRLPVPDNEVDTAVLVWVLQLVDDPRASLREAARVVRPGGRVLAILAAPENDPDDEIAAILEDLAPLLRIGRGPDPLMAAVPPAMRRRARSRAVAGAARPRAPPSPPQPAPAPGLGRDVTPIGPATAICAGHRTSVPLDALPDRAVGTVPADRE